jgi:hypothetical protein
LDGAGGKAAASRRTPKGFLVNHNSPPLFFVSVASKRLRVCVSGLESTLAGTPLSVDSKGSYKRHFGAFPQVLILNNLAQKRLER